MEAAEEEAVVPAEVVALEVEVVRVAEVAPEGAVVPEAAEEEAAVAAEVVVAEVVAAHPRRKSERRHGEHRRTPQPFSRTRLPRGLPTPEPAKDWSRPPDCPLFRARRHRGRLRRG